MDCRPRDHVGHLPRVEADVRVAGDLLRYAKHFILEVVIDEGSWRLRGRSNLATTPPERPTRCGRSPARSVTEADVFFGHQVLHRS